MDGAALAGTGRAEFGYFAGEVQMPKLTGHFEAVVRGAPCCVPYVYDCDDADSCFECVEVAVAGLALSAAERRRLVAKAYDVASDRSWRSAAPPRRRRRA